MSNRLFVEIDPALRRRIEVLIESLIDVCDQIDAFAEDIEPDADFEPDCDAEAPEAPDA